jgi:hypothetical protein
VATLLWNWWQLSRGISGSFAVELVATFTWNQWQLSCGIDGSFAVELVVTFAWNTQYPNMVIYSEFRAST